MFARVLSLRMDHPPPALASILRSARGDLGLLVPVHQARAAVLHADPGRVRPGDDRGGRAARRRRARPAPRSRATASTWRHLAVVALLFCSIPFTLFAYGETQRLVDPGRDHQRGDPAGDAAGRLRRVPGGAARRVTGPPGSPSGSWACSSWSAPGTASVAGELRACSRASGRHLCYGIAFPYTRRHLVGTGEGPIAIATGQVILGAPSCSRRRGPAARRRRRHGAVEPRRSSGCWRSGALGSGIAYVLNTQVVIEAGATVASSVTYITPLVRGRGRVHASRSRSPGTSRSGR